jgi:hypothetical protein
MSPAPEHTLSYAADLTREDVRALEAFLNAQLLNLKFFRGGFVTGEGGGSGALTWRNFRPWIPLLVGVVASRVYRIRTAILRAA